MFETSNRTIHVVCSWDISVQNIGSKKDRTGEYTCTIYSKRQNDIILYSNKMKTFVDGDIRLP